MPCYAPQTAYKSKHVNPSGKRSLTWRPQEALDTSPLGQVTIACGQCIGCRLERSRQWAVRCMHEAQLHDANAFITLTYDDNNVPSDYGLRLEDFQKFMKRLRKKHQVRFFHCGEYGSRYGRPHYHAIIFGHDFRPWEAVGKTQSGEILYMSEELAELWKLGRHQVGEMTFKSAAYVARYIVDKKTGLDATRPDPDGLTYYESVDPTTGEVTAVRPEYTTMSRRPGIGKPWYDKYKQDIYAYDECIVNGKKVKPPKVYDGYYEVDEPEAFSRIKARRKEVPQSAIDNGTWQRLEVRERVKKAQIKNLKRRPQ